MVDGHQLSFVLHMQIQRKVEQFCHSWAIFFWLAKKLHGYKDQAWQQ